MVKCQAIQYSGVGLAKLLFRNIGLLTKVCKNNQFKVKIIIFTAVLRFIGIELSQVGQLLTISLYLGRLWIYNLRIYSLQVYSLRIYSLRIYGLWICNLRIYGLWIYSLWIYSLWIYSLNSRGDLVHILVYRGVVVCNLRVGYILASKVSSKAAQVYKISLVEWVRYKVSDYIKFGAGKEFLNSVVFV